MEKRRHPRFQVDGMMADISDGIGFFSGSVEDISRFGVCLTNIAKKLEGYQDQLTVVISGQGKNFKFKVMKRWEKNDTLGKTLGVTINNVPCGWTKLVMDFDKSADDDDVWGNAR